METLKLFILTISSSLYVVEGRRDEHGNVWVEKVGEREPHPNMAIGDRLMGGRQLGVMPPAYGGDAVTYNAARSGGRWYDPDHVNIVHFGVRTSRVVAMFLREADAKEAMIHGALEPWSEDLKPFTVEALHYLSMRPDVKGGPPYTCTEEPYIVLNGGIPYWEDALSFVPAA